MTSVVITLPLPPRSLSPNARVHWRRRAADTKTYREAAHLMTLAAGGRGKRWERAKAQATFYWPINRCRDIRNAEHSLKATYDGIVDAGLIIDDNHNVLTHLPTIFEVDPVNPRVEIRVTKSDCI